MTGLIKIDFLLPALHDLRIGSVEFAPFSSGSVMFNAEHCIDSNLYTSCRPGGSGPHAISVELVGPPGFEIDVKSVTIYTPPVDVEGYTPRNHEIKVNTYII